MWSNYSKIGDWDFEDGFGPTEDPVEEKRPLVSRVAVLKHMFTLQELKDDPSLFLELKEDVREEAEGLGDVTNVVLYDVSYSLKLGCTAEVSAAGTRRGHDGKVPGPYQCASLCSRTCPALRPSLRPWKGNWTE